MTMSIKTAGLTLAMGLALSACAAPQGPSIPRISDEPNQCRASDYTRYIGRQRSEVPAAPAGVTMRVLCSTCPATLDHNPGRLNIVYDVNTNVVTRVHCG